MARKLKTEEAEVFNGAMDNAQIPTDAEAFVRSLLDKQEEPLDLTVLPGLWINNAPSDPFQR